jgi:hypothetical protein
MTTLIAAAKKQDPVKLKYRELRRDGASLTVLPWSCDHFNNHSKINAYVMAAGETISIAHIEQTRTIDAEKLANFIATAVNEHEKMKGLIVDLVKALELCIQDPKMDWKTLYQAMNVISRATNSSN